VAGLCDRHEAWLPGYMAGAIIAENQ
jgi:hypothetical protein